MNDERTTRTVDCCIAGGGPAGVMLGLLLARQGADVLLLEAHQNFDRDFRGDTVHPSTVGLLEEIGLLDELLALPHAAMFDFPFHYSDGSISPPPSQRDVARRPQSYQVPQHLLLDMLVREARRYPTFHVAMGARVDELLYDGTTVCGLQYTSADGRHAVRASVVVGADGRFSKLRQLAGLQLQSRGEPMDILWFRLPKSSSDPERASGLYLGTDGMLVVMDRPDGWQVGYVFAKGAYQRIRGDGVAALRRSVVQHAEWLADRVDALQHWRQTSLLSVASGRLERWYAPGLLLIGDAAHVMTPVGGVGINYAIQDAVVASNVLGPRLLTGTLRTADLARVQRRRELPTRLMQAMQRRMNPFTDDGTVQLQPPLALRLVLNSAPLAELRRRLISYGGWRPERVCNSAPFQSVLRAAAARILRWTGDELWKSMCSIDARAFTSPGWALGHTHRAARLRSPTRASHETQQRHVSKLGDCGADEVQLAAGNLQVCRHPRFLQP
jgi:2-polyprenyl-6-methoxyphenol hydroxylase-like FAD-dependent oxidoreductase